jgi:hypothetical protein
MTIVTRMTALFSLTTTPVNRATANPHTGGWSESWWTTQSGPTLATSFTNLLKLRAALLPASAQITGSRQSTFTIQGNRLIPGPTSSSEQNFPGNANYVTDLPQAALQLKGYGDSVSNHNSFYLRGIPDAMIVGGEYSPTRPFGNAVSAFKAALVGPWGFVARDLSQPRLQVLALVQATPPPPNQAILQLAGVLAGVAANSFLRFSRVYGSDGNPIKGAFAVTQPPVGNLYTLQMPNVNPVFRPSGTARLDLLTYIAYSSVAYNRAGVKKVGRPSEGYRGRRSA